MSKFIDRLFFRSNTAYGVSVDLGGDQDFYTVCCLKKSAKSINSSLTQKKISLEELLKLLKGTKAPVSLVFTGKGIINKKINRSNETEILHYFRKVFPSGNEAEFYTQVYYGSRDLDFVSVIRRSIVDAIIEKFTAEKIDITGLFLGPFSSELVFPLLDNKASVFNLNLAKYKLSIEEGKIKEVGDNPDQIEKLAIPGFDLDSENLLSFTGAFSYFFPLGNLVQNNSVIQANKQEYRYKTAFTKLLRTGVGALLLITLINFLVFNKYFEKQKTLDSELIVHENALKRHEKLNNEYNSKNDFLEKAGLLVGSKTSFLADRLVYDLPDDIQLTQLQVYPNLSAVEKDSVLKFNAKQILIKGFCLKSIQLNEWVRLIKSKNFIEDVYLANYIVDSEKDHGKFDLMVTLK